MTDNEIIKALECCTTQKHCWGCPRYDSSVNACMEIPMREVFDLINRKNDIIDSLIAEQETLQKALAEKNAEVERLKKFKYYFDDLYGIGLEVAEWHHNGMLEPFDNFYDSAIEEMDK